MERIGAERDGAKKSEVDSYLKIKPQVLPRKRPRNHKLDALEHALSGSFENALQSADKAVLENPQDTESYLLGSLILSDLGFYSEAATRYEAARQTDVAAEEAPLRSRTAAVLISENLTQLGQIYFDLGQMESARAEWERALQAFETLALRRLLAKLCMQDQEFLHALGHLEAARRINASDPDVLTMAAHCYFLMNRFDECRETLERKSVLGHRSLSARVLRRALNMSGE